MADALKDMFNKKFYERLALAFNEVDKNFHSDKFINQVIKNIDSFSLNQRLRNTSVVLKEYLPNDYKKALDIIYEVAPQFKSHYTALLFPDFIGQYGHNDVDRSLDALKILTQYGSSEFAIREFLKRDFDKTIKVMNKWAEDKNYHVRRLASEGCRARLPWSFNLDQVMKNPERTKSILEKLKADEELYVKKSVANHLNDFSNKNTQYLLDLMNSWDKTNPNTAWIIKHASRTLIKKGHQDSLAIFNYEKKVQLNLTNFKMKSLKINLGDSLLFSFDLTSEKSKSQKLVVDYAIYYQKKSGELVPKVFKLKELNIKANEVITISKSHRFQDFTTRKHYAGKHAIEIVINGKSYFRKDFTLVIP
jgi:3-methyladenine DNA glycosylase AlkC